MTLPSLHDFRPSADAPNRCAYCSRVEEVHALEKVGAR